MPTTQTTIVSHDRLILLYAIVRGLAIDVGKVIQKEIRESALKKQKTAALFFPSLITSICEAFGERIEEKFKRVKNEGAIIARIVERISVESVAAATPEHPTIEILERPSPVKTEQAPGLKEMIQALSEVVQACI